MIEVSYNHKSPFAQAWLTGSQRFDGYELFAHWLKATIEAYGPVIVTEIKAVR